VPDLDRPEPKQSGARLCATNSTVASVGIRELRQRASELLRRVEDGESIEITDRGRPVAVLAPLPADPLERLIAAGDLQPSDGDITDLPEPLVLPAGTELPSAALARLRRDER
jgi:prevent-host-death family protein